MLKQVHAVSKHRRLQWLDRSSPAYNGGHTIASSNTTHGSGWNVQVLPTNEGTRSVVRIPPTGVGGSLNSCLHRGPTTALVFVSPRGTREEGRSKDNPDPPVG